jgi:hypothetical protein
MDTRPGEGKSGAFGPPFLAANSTRDIPISQSGCDAPANAAGYSLNITVVPRGSLPYVTVYPSGQSRPLVSTLNSFDGKVVANAAIVPSGAQGAITIYAAGDTEVIVDINGYLAPQ